MEYADYLSQLATAAKLNVRTSTEVVSVRAVGAKGGSPLFAVEVRGRESGSERQQPVAKKPKAAGKAGANREELAARDVVWAAGPHPDPNPNQARPVRS